MRAFVVDTNVLFSFFKRDSFTRRLIFKVSQRFDLYTADFAYFELMKYSSLILKKTGLSAAEFDVAVSVLRSLVVPIWLSPASDPYKYAEQICPDPKDVPFVALAMDLDVPLWSNDLRLKDIRQIRVLSTSEVADLLKRSD